LGNTYGTVHGSPICTQSGIINFRCHASRQAKKLIILGSAYTDWPADGNADWHADLTTDGTADWTANWTFAGEGGGAGGFYAGAQPLTGQMTRLLTGLLTRLLTGRSQEKVAALENSMRELNR